MNNRNKIVVAVKGVILNEGKVLIVQRSNYDQIGAGTWECAGGKIEFGEELETALIREIKEEVGLDVQVDKILYASSFHTDPARQVVILTYLCRSSQKEVTLSHEHMNYCWADRHQFKLLMTRGIIQDFEKNNLFSLTEWI